MHALENQYDNRINLVLIQVDFFRRKTRYIVGTHDMW
jgi:hypothetical protein